MADTKISDLAAVTDVQATDEYVLARAGANKKIDASDLAAGISLFNAYALIRDEQTSGTDAGSSASLTWTTRPLNTEVADPDGIVSISSNQFTLQAGTYFLVSRAPCLGGSGTVENHRLRLRNITDGATVDVGSTAMAFGAQTDAWLRTRFAIAGAKAFEIQHWVAVGRATNGLGLAAAAGVAEVFCEVEIWREA